MKVSISIDDGISRHLSAKIRRLADTKPILRAAGMALVSIATRAFDEPALRPAAWPPRKRNTGKPLLIRTSALRRSLRVVEVDAASVTVGTDRPYAAVHQFGTKKAKGRGSGIPPRPFFPVIGTPGKLTSIAAREITLAVKRAMDDALVT